jgi:hypothetical protein
MDKILSQTNCQKRRDAVDHDGHKGKKASNQLNNIYIYIFIASWFQLSSFLCIL